MSDETFSDLYWSSEELERSVSNEPDDLPPVSTPSGSSKYWEIMQQVAENEQQLKLEQRQNEEERMEFARDLHHKNMLLLDLKIKVQQMKIQKLEGSTNS